VLVFFVAIAVWEKSQAAFFVPEDDDYEHRKSKSTIQN